MASSMPEIGSKISLISKADIRYEGKLFTVDPNECTIALSHVRSFGTEDRQTQYPVPAQSQVYEYILFRGSDIKDITIVNTQQLPNDPAIVSGMAPGMAPSMPAPYPNHSYNSVMSGPVGAPQYNYTAPGVGRKPMSSELLPDNVHVPPPVQVQVQVPKPMIPLVKEPTTELLSGSRSSTPSQARKSPSIDQSVQVSPHKDNTKKPIQPPVPRDNRQNRNDRNYQELYQRRDYRNQRDGDYRGPRDGDFRGQRDGDYRGPRDGDFRGQREGDYRGQRDGDFRGPRDGDFRGQREQRDGDYRGQRDGDYRGPRDQEHRVQDTRRENFATHQQMRGQSQGQGMGRGGGWVNRGGRGGSGGGGSGIRGNRGRGGNFNRAPGSQQQNNSNPTKKNTLKFDEEYDFDKANSEFEELKNKTAKLKISDCTDAVEGEAEKPKVVVNGEEKKDDSGNETGLGEGEPEEDGDPDSVIYYDKAKSFFDNISCEAIERSKGRSQRTDWRTERKLNSETFGVASARRGGYRGRGGYYGGRGLYRGYRGYNNMRGQGNRGGVRTTHSQQPQAVTAAAK